MLRSLHIQNFRALREFRMSGLGRVNLLVGTNNSGKTSVLEAIHTLSLPGKADPLWDMLTRRGEYVEGIDQVQANVAHLFNGHRIAKEAAFSIKGDYDARSLRLSCRVQGALQKKDQKVEELEELLGPLALVVGWIGLGPRMFVHWPLSERGGLQRQKADELTSDPEAPYSSAPTNFVTVDGLSRPRIVEMFDAVVLTVDEQTVMRALQVIEPGIERLAAIGTSTFGGNRGGLAMMVDGQRVPIGSMGDGIWRLLGIALALVRSQGGVLLVDEIDTGLHYTVLEKMWRLVFETAHRLDVQVFATTHSRDCYEALAAVAKEDRREISIQRIERDKAEAVAYDEAEILVAAERGIEVR